MTGREGVGPFQVERGIQCNEQEGTREAFIPLMQCNVMLSGPPFRRAFFCRCVAICRFLSALT